MFSLGALTEHFFCDASLMGSQRSLAGTPSAPTRSSRSRFQIPMQAAARGAGLGLRETACSASVGSGQSAGEETAAPPRTFNGMPRHDIEFVRDSVSDHLSINRKNTCSESHSQAHSELHLGLKVTFARILTSWNVP